MTNLTELHQIAVATAEALRKIQAQVKAEREASDDGMAASRESIIAQKEAKKAFEKAMRAFQNEVDAVGAVNVPDLKALYDAIGQTKVYA